MKNLFKFNLILIILFNNVFALTTTKETSYINTENITYNHIDNTIELGENSLINIDDNNLYLDKGIIDYNKDRIEVEGLLYIYQGQSILSSTDLIGNTKLTNFKTNKVSYIYNDDLKVDSAYMEREENEVYFYDNFLTPCELDGFFNCPTWSLKIPKTKYLVNEDKFIHYDSLLQIADKKIFYLPYLSHYGAKAPRQKGFLTPTFDFNLLNGGITTKIPYYIPINISNDLTFTPYLELSSNSLELPKNIKINSVYNGLNAGGSTNLDMTTIFNENNDMFYNSISINTNQTLNKKNQLEFNTLITNSISTTRSDNTDQLNYESSYIRINSYDVYKKNDILISEINTVISFDESDNNLIPIQSPYLEYINFVDLDSNTYLYNYLNIFSLERSNSYLSNPKKNTGFNLTNEITNNYIVGKSLMKNKLIIDSIFRTLEFDDASINDEYTQNSIRFSSIYNSPKYENLLSSHIKFIVNEDIKYSDKSTNEDSNSYTFNYQHLFKENRFYGYDKSDNSKRVVYGLEFEKDNELNKYFLNLGQSYDFSTDNQYLNIINQNQKLSDVALEAGMANKFFKLKLDSRLNKQNLSKKEMNYSLNLNYPNWDASFNYNETSNESFITNSDNSKALKNTLNFDINDNISMGLYNNLDLKNDYYPFESVFNIALKDECSQLEIEYTNTKYSDNFNTTPKETISLTYRMDYLGFFGYEQNTDLFFKEAGTYFYGTNN